MIKEMKQWPRTLTPEYLCGILEIKEEGFRGLLLSDGRCVRFTGIHESLLRSHQILSKVKGMLGVGVHADIILELVAEMEEVEYEKTPFFSKI